MSADQPNSAEGLLEHGRWVPADGDYCQRHDGNSNVHIAVAAVPDHGPIKVTMACGGGWYSSALRHASDEDATRRPCRKCWEAM